MWGRTVCFYNENNREWSRTVKYESSSEKNIVPSLLEGIFKIRMESGQQLSETDHLQVVHIANVLFGHSSYSVIATDGNSCFQNSGGCNSHNYYCHKVKVGVLSQQKPLKSKLIREFNARQFFQIPPTASIFKPEIHRIPHFKHVALDYGKVSNSNYITFIWLAWRTTYNLKFRNFMA